MEEVVQQTSPWEVAGTLATVAAVLVALFGPALRDWWTRPRIQLLADPESARGMWLAGQTGEIGGPLVFVGVHNAGRQQANDVQVFISIAREVDIPSVGKALSNGHDTYQTPVAFMHQEGGQWTPQHSVAIPWGFTRPLQLLQRIDGKIRVAHRRVEAPGGAIQNGVHLVALDVLGSNFKVQRFFGVIDIDAGTDMSTSTWILEPEGARYTSKPFPKELVEKARKATSA